MRIKKRTEARQATANWKDKIWIPTVLPEELGAVPYFSLLSDRKRPQLRVGAQMAFFPEDYFAYAAPVFTRWPLEKGFHIVLEVASYDGERFHLKIVGTNKTGKEVFKTRHSLKHFSSLNLDGLAYKAEFKFGLKRTVSRLRGTNLRHAFDLALKTEHSSLIAFLQYIATENFGLLRKETPSFLSVILIRLKHA